MSVMPADPHLPVAHLRPPRNWINDPNGLAYHDGHYHVCFQYNPHGPDHATMHWGHFRSPDLLTWEELPVALTPTPGGPDADGCFSGNAVSDGDRMVAFYSAFRKGTWAQPVTTAESHDDGLTWTPRGSLLIPDLPEGTTMYRDPYVWREGSRWRMLVGSALADGRAAALLYESSDLEHWTYRGPFLDRAPNSSRQAPTPASAGSAPNTCTRTTDAARSSSAPGTRSSAPAGQLSTPDASSRAASSPRPPSCWTTAPTSTPPRCCTPPTAAGCCGVGPGKPATGSGSIKRAGPGC